MSTEDNESNLRDQIAIAAMQTLLQQFPRLNFRNLNVSMSQTGMAPPANSGHGTINNVYHDDETYYRELQSKIEKISIMAYRIADEMRKARLQSFI